MPWSELHFTIAKCNSDHCSLTQFTSGRTLWQAWTIAIVLNYVNLCTSVLLYVKRNPMEVIKFYLFLSLAILQELTSYGNKKRIHVGMQHFRKVHCMDDKSVPWADNVLITHFACNNNLEFSYTYLLCKTERENEFMFWNNYPPSFTPKNQMEAS